MTEAPDSYVMWEGLRRIDVERAREVWRDLRAGPEHDEYCRCPSCERKLLRSWGWRFSRETLLFNWLELEALLSLVPQKDYTTFRPRPLCDEERTSVEWLDLERWKGQCPKAKREACPESRRSQCPRAKRQKGTTSPIQAVAAFVKEHFPEIRTSPARIKMNLWRYHKSGVEAKLDEELLGRRTKRDSKWDEGDPWQRERLAQRVADYVYERPMRSVAQRDLQRRVQRPVEVLEDLRPWLFVNYGIEVLAGRRKGQVVYRGRMKNARGRVLRVGVDLPTLGKPVTAVKSIDYVAIEKAVSRGYEPGRQIFIAYCPGAPKSWAKEYWTLVVKDPIFLDWALDRLADSGGKAVDGLTLKAGAGSGVKAVQ